MNDTDAQSVGRMDLPPPSLNSTQEELCERLDELHTLHGLLKAKPSDMFRGAVFASQLQVRANPDWIPQTANSLREILYPFGNEGIPNKEEALRRYGSVRVDEEVGRVFGALTELTHHGNSRGSSVDFLTYTAATFERLLADFERVMRAALSRQLDVHAEIDDIFESETPTAEVADSAEI